MNVGMREAWKLCPNDCPAAIAVHFYGLDSQGHNFSSLSLLSFSVSHKVRHAYAWSRSDWSTITALLCSQLTVSLSFLTLS